MNWIESARRDVRHAWRMIARMPVLATVVVLSLGVGIGVNTVIFSWIQAVVFKPIPGVAGAASFNLVEPRTETGMYPGTSWLEYRDLRERLRTFRRSARLSHDAALRRRSGAGRAGVWPARLRQLFLGARSAARARAFLPSRRSRAAGRRPVVVISHDVLADALRGRAGCCRAGGSRQRPRPDDRRRRAARIPGHGDPAEVRLLAAGHDGAGAADRIARARRARARAATPSRACFGPARRARRRRAMSTRSCGSWRRRIRPRTRPCRARCCRSGSPRAVRSG